MTDETPAAVPGTQPHHSLVAALAAFQSELPVVPKNATGIVPGNRNHKYADIADLNGAVLPRLAAVGLSWSCEPDRDEQGRRVLRWVLAHAPTGEHRTGEWELAGGTNWEIGSALTYARRYCLESVTGVAATEDDDGRAAAEAARPQAAPAQPTRPRTVAEARAYLGQAAAENGWDIDIIAGLYREEHGEALGDATDAARILKFRQGLFSRSDSKLKPKADAAANGAPST